MKRKSVVVPFAFYLVFVLFLFGCAPESQRIIHIAEDTLEGFQKAYVTMKPEFIRLCQENKIDIEDRKKIQAGIKKFLDAYHKAVDALELYYKAKELGNMVTMNTEESNATEKFIATKKLFLELMRMIEPYIH